MRKAEQASSQSKPKVGKLKKTAKPQPPVEGEGDEKPSAEDVHGMLQQGLAEARREIAQDQDLAELGIQDEVVGLLDAIGKGGNFEGALDAVIKAAMQGAGRMAVKEIRADQDLRKVGLGDGI